VVPREHSRGEGEGDVIHQLRQVPRRGRVVHEHRAQVGARIDAQVDHLHDVRTRPVERRPRVGAGRPADAALGRRIGRARGEGEQQGEEGQRRAHGDGGYHRT